MKNIMKKLGYREGFTIIEVVLVLAIAGLIFLVVFLAVPQLQRSRRDSQRKNDVGRALAALETYASNNNGSYPSVSGFAGFRNAYLTNNGGIFRDPTGGGTTYTMVTSLPNDEGEMRYRTSAVCSGQVSASSSGNPRNVAVVVFQESGGSYCQDNS